MSILLNTINISWIVPVISGVLFFIDSVVFAILEGAIRIIFIVGNINLNTLSGPLEYLISNIKSLVGIYIIFKLSLLFIQYLIEPDVFKDKTKGGEAVVKNIVVVVILLTLLSSNLLFGIFNDIQKVIFSNGDTTYEILNSIGITNLENKKTDMIQNLIFGKEFSDKPAHMLTVEIAQMFIHNCPGAGFVNKCKNPVRWEDESLELTEIIDFRTGTISAGAIFKTIYLSDYGASFFMLVQLDKIGNSFTSLQYISFISTVFGIYMIIKFFKYSLAIVIRAFKLFVMQIISPIAIVSYITPDGKKTFSNFWKTYFTIYLELFLRLFIVYVSIYIMIAFVSNKASIIGTHDPITNMVLNILIFMGVSKIMDELPDLISSLFGAKLGDSKQKSMSSILAGVIGGGIGAGIGIGSAKAAGVNGWGALFGGAMGMFGGAKSGSSAQNLGAFVSGQVSNATKAVGRGYDILQSGGKLGNYMQLQADKTFGHANAIKREHTTLTDSAKFHQDNAASVKQLDKSFQEDYARTYSDLNPTLSWARNREFDTVRQIAEAEAASGTNFDAVRERLVEHAKNGTTPTAPIDVTDSNGNLIGSYSNLQELNTGNSAFIDSREKIYKTEARKEGVAYIKRHKSGTTSTTYKDEKRTGSSSIYATAEERVQKFNTDYGKEEQFVDLDVADTTLSTGTNYFKVRETAETEAHTKSMNKLRDFNKDQRNINIISGGK